jgi:hypothetical protein
MQVLFWQKQRSTDKVRSSCKLKALLPILCLMGRNVAQERWLSALQLGLPDDVAAELHEMIAQVLLCNNDLFRAIEAAEKVRLGCVGCGTSEVLRDTISCGECVARQFGCVPHGVKAIGHWLELDFNSER